MVVAKDWREKNGELLFNGDRVSVGKMSKVLQVDGVEGCTTR